MRTRANLVALIVLSASRVAAQQPAASGIVHLSGRIVTVCHEGIPAAEVSVTDADGRQLGHTVADGEGCFQLPRLPLSAHWLHARAPGRCPGRLPIAAPTLVRAVTLELEDGEPLRGRLVLPDGMPAANAALVIEPAERLGAPFDWFVETATDALGAWSVPVAPLRARVLRAYLPERPLLELAIAAGDGVVQGTFAAGPARLRRVTVKDLPAGTVATVTSEVGSPWLSNQRRWPAAACTGTCDAAGEAVLPLLPVAHELRVTASGRGCIPASVHCGVGDDRALTFTLQASAPIPVTEVRGRLVDSRGAPLAAMPLVMGVGDVYRTVTTGDDGEFVGAVQAYPGAVVAFAVHDPAWRLGNGALLMANGLVWLCLRPGSKALTLVALPAASLRATLRRPDGPPLATATVTLQLLAPGQNSGEPLVQCASDAAGRIVLGGLPSGRYLIAAMGGSWCGSTELRLDAGRSTALGELDWIATGEISGRVLDAGGKAVPSVSILAVGQHRHPVAGHPMQRGAKNAGDAGGVLSDREGRFRIPGLPVGPWYLSTRRPRARDSVRVTVESGLRTEVDLTER